MTCIREEQLHLLGFFWYLWAKNDHLLLFTVRYLNHICERTKPQLNFYYLPQTGMHGFYLKLTKQTTTSPHLHLCHFFLLHDATLILFLLFIITIVVVLLQSPAVLQPQSHLSDTRGRHHWGRHPGTCG